MIIVEEENNKNILDITDKRTPDEVNTVPRRNRNGPAREKIRDKHAEKNEYTSTTTEKAIGIITVKSNPNNSTEKVELKEAKIIGIETAKGMGDKLKVQEMTHIQCVFIYFLTLNVNSCTTPASAQGYRKVPQKIDNFNTCLVNVNICL